MTKYSGFFFIVFLGTLVSVTAQTYSFTASTETYEPLTNSTSLNNGAVWDDPGYSIP